MHADRAKAGAVTGVQSDQVDVALRRGDVEFSRMERRGTSVMCADVVTVLT